MDLGSEYLGLRLRTPLVASPSALTSTLPGLRRLEDAGAAAVVLSPLFEEEILLEALDLDPGLETWAESLGEAPSYFREFDGQRTRPERYLELVSSAKGALGIPVIASLNVSMPGPWVDQAKLIEEAGADALEITVFVLPADPNLRPADLEARYREIVSAARSMVRIPLAVKLSPFFSALAHTAKELCESGADGLVLFHRGYMPYLNLDTLEVAPTLPLSTSQQVLLPLRWIAILRDHLEASLAAAGGVHTPRDAIRLLLAGADAVMMSSALVEHGPEHLGALEQGLRDWMEQHEYASVRQLKGSASRNSVSDPSAYERVSYVKTLKTFFGSLAS
jgi:dihydroorotate dehydrogenase (fumarate)